MKTNAKDELIDFFIKELPLAFAAIEKSFNKKNYKSLKAQLHKLQGALCYCNIPSLKSIVTELELSLKKEDYANLSSNIFALQEKIANLTKK